MLIAVLAAHKARRWANIEAMNDELWETVNRYPLKDYCHQNSAIQVRLIRLIL